ncbi:MAG TPA: hypothetical protein VIG47_10720, partial [Gemmatimonadaceae bacterium]
VKYQDERPLCGQINEEVAYLMEERRLIRYRTDRAALGKDGGQRRFAIGWLVARKQFQPRAIRRRFRNVVAAPNEHQRALFCRFPAKRFRERGLADARLATDQDEATVSRERGIKTIAQDRLLAFAPDE